MSSAAAHNGTGTPPAACTIISRNYLSHARVLAESYLRHEPGARFYLLVVDKLPAGVEAGRGIHVIQPEELRLPYFYEMCFKYDVTELSTAVKPTLLSLLMNEYREREVLYFDPDILVLRPLDEIKRCLASAEIVLIPHLLEPIPLDGKRPSEQDILIAGAYNLGFIAMKDGPETARLLTWWEERLRDHCRVSPAEGLMVDQRWVDLVPGLFPSTNVLHDDTCDVAYWNLHGRRLDCQSGKFLVNGRPLGFFHFSGFDPAHPSRLSKHQDRLQITDGTPLKRLIDLYVDLQRQSGHAVSSGWEYGYDRFDNGIRVHPLLRQLYLTLDEETRAPFVDPFAGDGSGTFLRWAIESRGDDLSPFLARIYGLRYDLAAAFPDVAGPDREAFVHWAGTQGAAEMGYEPELVLDRRSSNGGAASATRASDSMRRGSEILSTSVPPQNGADWSKAGVNVCGYLRDESGLGAAVRGYVRALRSLGTPLSLIDVGALSVNRSEDATIVEPDGEPRFGVNLICVNADEHFHLMSHLGEEFFRGHYNIGIWAWELPRFPEEWSDRFPWYDEIWVGTSFIANALARVAPMPVVVVPPVLTVDHSGSRRRGRKRLGVSDDEFLFTFMFDFHSYFERKNPLALVEAFKRAFEPEEPVELAIKCVNEHVGAADLAELRARAEGHRVSIHTGYWQSEQVRDLIAACDAYASLHRAEGTGLTISDAMALGKPVIATDWSGNVDFMDVSNSFPVGYELVQLERDIGPYRAGETWAEPSIEDAARLMRLVVDDREEADRRGRRARSDIERNFSAERIAAIVHDRLVAGRGGRTQEVIARHPEEAPPTPESKWYPNYPGLVRAVRETVAAVTPSSATVVVISRGDDQLLELGGRQAWHFPRTEDGQYAGFYPADAAGAIAHLEMLRAQGADFLVIPASASWWLVHYDELRRHLEAEYRRVYDESSICTVFELTAQPRAPQPKRRGSAKGAGLFGIANGRKRRQAAADHAKEHEEKLSELERQLTSLAGLDRSTAAAKAAADEARELGEALAAQLTEAIESQPHERETVSDLRSRLGELERTVRELSESASVLERGLREAEAANQVLLGRVETDSAQIQGLSASAAERLDRLDAHAAAVERDLRELVGTASLEALEQRVLTLAGSLQSEVESLRTVAAAQQAELEQRVDPAAVEALEREIERIAALFTSRPYMSRDAFGAFGDLERPLGFGVDAAHAESGPQQPDRFIDLFRGEEGFILERQRVYVPFFRGRANVVDLGCGRGEFLRLLCDEGQDPIGVERDRALVDDACARGLRVIEADAVQYLTDIPPGALDGIFSAQVIEHLESSQLRELFELARSRLCVGGILVAETVNPESFEALKTFWVDPTHRFPIFPQVLLHLCQESGFRSARVFYPNGGGFTQRHYATAGEYAVVAIV